MFEKLKSLLADDALFLALLVVLVSIVSFGLGRASVDKSPVMDHTGGVQLRESVLPPQRAVESEPVTESIQVVASRSGTKYHLLTCPGASQIKEENKLYFTSIDQAEAAGYTPAANCPGL